MMKTYKSRKKLTACSIPACRNGQLYTLLYLKVYTNTQIPPCSDTGDGSDDFTDDAETVHRTRKFVVSTLPLSPSAGCENKEKSRSPSGTYVFDIGVREGGALPVKMKSGTI
jgi:hypothetical protein